MLYLILGKLGSGKTLLMTYIALNFNRENKHSNRHLFANYHIRKSSIKTIQAYQLIDLPINSEIFLDEGYAWLESRTSMRDLNKYLSYILLQSRKTKTNFYITIQDLSTIDKRFRYQCDYLIVCQLIGTIKNPKAFKYYIINRNEGKFITKIMTIEQAKKIFYRFDTNEIIEPYNVNTLEYNLLKENPDLLLKRAEQIARELKISGKITHPKVKLALLKQHFDVNFEPTVYLLLLGEVD